MYPVTLPGESGDVSGDSAECVGGRMCRGTYPVTQPMKRAGKDASAVFTRRRGYDIFISAAGSRSPRTEVPGDISEQHKSGSIRYRLKRLKPDSIEYR